MLPSMAISTTTSVVTNESVGNRRSSHRKFTMSGTYSTGGYAVDKDDFGLNTVEYVECWVAKPITGFAAVDYDSSTDKILAYTSAGAEVTNATADTGLVVYAVGYGT